MSLISPDFDVKSIIFSQCWPGAFSQNCWKEPCAFYGISNLSTLFVNVLFGTLNMGKLIPLLLLNICFWLLTVGAQPRFP